jgi:5'-nucleotidase/UDP-sugar diphosphatase
MAVGNHEFDNPFPILKKQQSWAGFPFLSANIYHRKTGQRVFRPFVDFTFDDKKVRVMGLTTSRTPVQSSPTNTAPFLFKSELEEAKNLVPKYRGECDALIVLSHVGHGKVGIGGDADLASKVKGIDAIFGGHSETALFKPLHHNGCLVFQAQNWGKYVGRADFVHANGKLELKSYKLISVNLLSSKDTARITEDKELHAFLKPFYEKEKDVLHRVVAYTDRDLSKPMLMKLIATGMIDTAKGSEDTDLPILAFMNKGGCRLPRLSKGKILFRDALMILPFGNSLCQVDLSGKELLPFLAHAQRRGIVAGGEYQGKDYMVDGKPIRQDGIYRLVLGSYIAAGGERFPVLTKHPKFKDLKIIDSDAFAAYLTKVKKPRDAVPKKEPAEVN